MKQPKKILLVDTDKTMLLSLAHALEAYDAHIITCNQLIWAQEAMSRYSFDLIITDLGFSKSTSTQELSLVLAAKKYNPKIKVVITTTPTSLKAKQEITRIGVDAYLEKPFGLNRLLQTIEQLGICTRKNAPISHTFQPSISTSQ